MGWVGYGVGGTIMVRVRYVCVWIMMCLVCVILEITLVLLSLEIHFLSTWVHGQRASHYCL